MAENATKANEPAHESEHHGVGHIAPRRALIGTCLALLVLTWVTVGVSYIDLGELNIWIALGVAALKGSLVALFFMHLRWDRPFNAIVFCVALAFVALFIALAMTDTSEYQPDVIPGDAPAVQTKLQEVDSQ
jgi:cytochrome c oxidase subunit 4